MEIILRDRTDVGDSWFLFCSGYGHCGYVQKMSGNVHLFSSVPIECKSEIKKQVEHRLGKTDLPVSQAPPVPEWGDDDDDA